MAATMPEDTQWGRYEVFQQTRDGAPFSNVGSVHAPDPEIALQNARDVFVRRPQTYRLWVVPAGKVFSRTSQEVAVEDWQPDEQTEPAGDKRYYVFRKTSQRRSMTFVTHSGELHAASPRDALRKALQRYGQRETFVWWIVPANAVVASREDDVESMFEPAHDKTYRMPSEYHTQTMMRELEEQDGDA